MAGPHLPPVELERSGVDLLTATAGDLRERLESGETTSVELVRLYLDQSAKHNHDGMKLHAINAVVSRDALFDQAMALDAERKNSGPRSPLHGIPITLKNFYLAPSFGLETTCGSFALEGLTASEDAAIATALRDAGCIVIGLANLSEWGNGKGSNLTAGWSAVGGQTQTPYVKGGVDPDDQWLGHSTPGGSSSGSAVGTTAGFAALSVGSESDGSIVQPAIRAALYSIKGAVGDVNMKGTMSGGAGFDSAGPLAKSVEDCADVMDILLPGRNFCSHLTKSWDGLHIAYLDYKTGVWHVPCIAQILTFLLIGAHDCQRHGKDRQLRWEGCIECAVADARGDHERVWHSSNVGSSEFLALFNKPELRTVQDLVDFNKQHYELELPPDQPSQSVLENAAKDNMNHEKYLHDLGYLRKSYREAVEKCFEATSADVIMASGESYLTSIASGAGYPITSVPLGFSSYNGRPYGMEILARNGEEQKIFRVMSAWEVSFPDARNPPPLLPHLSLPGLIVIRFPFSPSLPFFP
ncbi:amidase signature domain-containing protein [Dichotomopilus funicola]|uniref:Amidase signature domain-containing protein n=1 Tax=Dichotomopilus funicola TaxID=1934379 RepID=A0AAN6ZMU8_9PEZI|nr:amidase signature domain-containing protein [Dichotomopilus funicola]